MPMVKMKMMVLASIMAPLVAGFGGSKTTVYIPCNDALDGSKFSLTAENIMELVPSDTIILNASCAFASLSLQSYSTIIVSINSNNYGPATSDINALGQL